MVLPFSNGKCLSLSGSSTAFKNSTTLICDENDFVTFGLWITPARTWHAFPYCPHSPTTLEFNTMMCQSHPDHKLKFLTSSTFEYPVPHSQHAACNSESRYRDFLSLPAGLALLHVALVVFLHLYSYKRCRMRSLSYIKNVCR